MHRSESALLLASAAALLVACSSGTGPSAAPEGTATTAACEGSRTLTCAFFDEGRKVWSADPPASLSLSQACRQGGAHGEIDAYVDTPAQYWLDRIGFQATGSAVRAASGTVGASDDAGGTTYGCGHGGGKVLTQLLCGQDVGTGTLTFHFAFEGRWSDGTAWTKECDATVDVLP